jgi:hypothetical protein
VLTLYIVSQVATTPATLAFVHKLAAIVRAARLESCGALGVSSDVPIGVPVIIGRYSVVKTTGFKLNLGILLSDDGISRSQAELQVGDVLELDTYRKPCQCKFMVLTACATALGRV